MCYEKNDKREEIEKNLHKKEVPPDPSIAEKDSSAVGNKKRRTCRPCEKQHFFCRLLLDPFLFCQRGEMDRANGKTAQNPEKKRNKQHFFAV